MPELYFSLTEKTRLKHPSAGMKAQQCQRPGFYHVALPSLRSCFNPCNPRVGTMISTFNWQEGAKKEEGGKRHASSFEGHDSKAEFMQPNPFDLVMWPNITPRQP